MGSERTIGPESFEAIRKETLDLMMHLSAEDCCVQSMPEASPIKWHLAHTTWFFETFILQPYKKDFRPFDPSYRALFNSYYNSIGTQFPRAQRGLITRPGLDDVLQYRRIIDNDLIHLCHQHPEISSLEPLITLGLHHEQQHQELMLTDLKHLFFMNPNQPAYDHQWRLPSDLKVKGSDWVIFEEGLNQMGHDGRGFSFDNERPRHRVFIDAFELSSQLVTQGEYLDFIEDGGYQRPELWLAEGWQWLEQEGITQPLYWQQRDGVWFVFTLAGPETLLRHTPLLHVSYYEADAFARWRGARLPTEAEWEIAAGMADGRDFDDLKGVAWQWTQSSYAPYPGFRTPSGAIGEYNGKFMVNQYVLRGSSLGTPKGHTRPTYRNFFPADTRWQFTGIRLARSPDYPIAP